MKFYCIVDDFNLPYNEESFKFLQKACNSRGIDFVVFEAVQFDYSQDMRQAIEIPCLMYRLGTGHRAAILEGLLQRKGVTNFYASPDMLFAGSFEWGSAIRLQRAGVPIIPTIFNIDQSQDSRLAAYVQQLGGFPVVLKAAGGSHGAGVLRIDSLESLRSVLGYVAGDDRIHFVLRKYIHDARHIRLVVIGDKVVDAIHYLPQPDDFRTNSVAVPQVEPFARTKETSSVFAMATQAVAAKGLEFGGVDILIDEQGIAGVAEVNFPCNFARNQMNTGVDVAGQMVDYLSVKARGTNQ